MAPGGLIFVMTIEITDGAESDTIGKKGLIFRMRLEIRKEVL